MRLPEKEIAKSKFAIVVASECPSLSPFEAANLVAYLMTEARYHDRYAVAMCCRDMTEREEQLHERRTIKLVERLAPLNIKAITGGDPRGCCLKLVMPSGYTDDWGRTGVCVPYK